MSERLDEVIEAITEVLREAATLAAFVRDRELQETNRQSLLKLDGEVEIAKQDFIEAGDEHAANVMLAYQCLADGIAEELSMWLALKDDNAAKAWGHLISAQEAIGAVQRTDIVFPDIQQHLQRLMLIERLVFPPQIYMSIGSIVHEVRCCICGSDYEECDHIAGNPYWGKFCSMIPGEIEPDHVALVDEPADKRCRVAFFADEGKKRDRMTWKLIDEPMEDRVVHGVLLAASGRWARMTFTMNMLEGREKSIIDKPLTR